MKIKDFCIPILMYHHVNPAGDFITVRPAVFGRHLEYLQRRGYTAIDTSELAGIMAGTEKPPRRPIMITFDDGWLDNWVFAFPVLKRLGMKAVIFVVTGHVAETGRRMRADEGDVQPLPEHREALRSIEGGSGSDVMLTWDEIREMQNSGLIDFQSHTHSHRRWDRLYEDRSERIAVLQDELRLSRRILEERLGAPCRALCWPWGRHDDEYVTAAKAEGYSLQFTTIKGTNTAATPLWSFRRIAIGNLSNAAFAKKLFIHSHPWLSLAYLRLF